jgi:hypothetical protein
MYLETLGLTKPNWDQVCTFDSSLALVKRCSRVGNNYGRIMKYINTRLSILSLALLAFLASCNQTPIPPSMTAVVGTYNYQIQPGQPNVLLGSSILVRLRSATNERVQENYSIQIRGTNGWNGDKSLTIEYPKNADWILYNNQNIPAVNGQFSYKRQWRLFKAHPCH